MSNGVDASGGNVCSLPSVDRMAITVPQGMASIRTVPLSETAGVLPTGPMTKDRSYSKCENDYGCSNHQNSSLAANPGGQTGRPCALTLLAPAPRGSPTVAVPEHRFGRFVSAAPAAAEAERSP